ncbi:MAG: plastocyanin/azurin family copper-binding protein [Zetaproteobacteria bacterium]|nr:plastocyanin/azurin family copper-binding protein [Zetaproteobacteria bacterium]
MRRFFSAQWIGCFLGLSLLGATPLWAGKQVTISQKGKKFSEKEITIKVGDEIKFINDDDTAHHLMFKAGGKKVSHKQPKGADPFVHKFEEEGKLKVRCAIHPKMKLKVKVEK